VGAALGGCGVAADDVNGNASSVKTLDAPKCTSETQGGPTSCKDEATWSAYGAMACAGKGLDLKHVSFAQSCGTGRWREATYDCCTAPTPPPRMCMWAPATIAPGTCLMSDAWKKEGIAFCSMHKLQLNDLKLDRPCGMGGFSAAQFECCTPTPPPPPPPPPMCTAQSLTEKSCIADATWKSRIEATCKAKMQSVGAVSFGAACMGGHLEVKFECCGPTPPPPPPPPMCTRESLASMSCVDDATWKLKADSVCTAKKQALGALAYGKACMGGHQDIVFECCGSPPPPPPPPACTTEVLTERSCVDDTTWKSRIEATCKAKMQSVGAVSFGAACMGGHLEVKFECCGPTPPPPPPPPMCTRESLASMSCVDDATWKLKADSVCTAKKQALGALAYGKACMGGHQDIVFECCGSPPPPPPPPVCSTEKAPSTGMCHTPAQWKTEGDTYCATKKQTLTGLSMSGPCMGGFSEAEFECCGATPPPPPTCTGGLLGDGRTCVAETTLKSQAEGTCKMAGLTLTAFSPYDACGAMGQYLHAKYECCK
jgi:hypothetical protein